MTHDSKCIGRSLWVAALALFTVSAAPVYGQKVDLNLNGSSDIWELLFHASGLDPNADADGDGISNGLEAVAGTDPFDANSVPRISPFQVSKTNVSVSMSSALGKRYSLQSTEVLCGPNGTNWITETNFVARSGAVVNLTAPANKGAKFFRMMISDVDTDGDGINDWEEYRLGLDPNLSASNGELDGNGQPKGDYAFVTGKLNSQDSITIVATDPTAVEPDAGQAATSLGTYTVSRGGFPLTALTVNLGLGGPGTGFATENIDHSFLTRPIIFPAGISSQTITLTPLANTNLRTAVIAMMKLQSGSGYTVSGVSNASIVIYPSPTAMGTGLTGQYYNNANSTYSNATNFTGLALTRLDPKVDFNFGTGSPDPLISNTTYSVRWTGQVQPQYSESYVFVMRSDEGSKLWVNGQLIIDNWVLKTVADANSVAINLQANVRYDIKLEYFQNTGAAEAHLSWYSPSQPKQIIPTARLYPTTVAAAPTAITSPLTAVGFLGQPFGFTVTGANLPNFYTANGLPPGLNFNSSNGVISGIPTLAGNFQVSLTASNAVGSAASVVNVQIFDTGSAVTREVWTNVPGTTIADIPVNLPPSSSGSFGALQGITDFGDNYAERIRGYLTAPTNGNYYFWIAGSDAMELWVSNDHEPANKVRRAYINGSGTGPQQWNVQPKQRSAWLALEAGQKYYIEVLHKAGTGTNDNWAVGWRLDAFGTNTVPTGIVPGYVLGRHFDLPPSFIPGTLYTANLLAQAGTISSAVGSATLRLSADGSQAVLKYSHTPLATGVTAKHIHADTYLGKNPQGQIVFDIDAATPEPDGSYVWNIVQSGALTPADLAEIVRQGKAYLNVHSAAYPAGEINGHFTFAEGSQTFTPPPAPPTWTDDHSNSNSAVRFLNQATFGASPTETASVQALGYDAWINNQFLLAATHHLPNVLANPSIDPNATTYPGTLTFNTWWENSVTAPDQLRQRVAFALSEIMVVSENGVLEDNGKALSDYYDVLLDNSFGNFREMLEAVTLTPAMGLYLDMRRNDKGDIILGTHPNENYAREILQLFSVGLNRMWPDGTLVMNSAGDIVPTYTQEEILGFARVFTGWNYWQPLQGNGRLPTGFNPGANYIDPMVLVPTHHELGTKRLLDNVMLPAAQGLQANSANVEYDQYSLQDLELALDSIFYNENCGPFICRQLIQRMVSSHPTREYLYRVVQKFNDNGSGVRGDMQAVIRAILLDNEARGTNSLVSPTYGKLREPLLRVTAIARAFPPPPPVVAAYSQSNSTVINITTPGPHRLNNNDDLYLSFTDTSGQPAPYTQPYNNVTVTSISNFTVSALNLSAGTYTMTTNVTITNMVEATMMTTNVIFVSQSGHGLALGNPVYLALTTGGAPSGVFQVIWMTNNNFFAVTTTDSSTNHSGTCLMPKVTGGGFTQTGTTVTFGIPGHGVAPGDAIYVNFPVGTGTDGQYTVSTVPDAGHFTITVGSSVSQTSSGHTIYPLVAPPLVRSGNATVRFNIWNMNNTDGNTTSGLNQTPLSAPTVFNFFFPDYKFPGILASAGLTTPEFQLASDTTVVLQMNFIESSLLAGINNTNGLVSFTGGNGAIMLDFGPWMSTNYTSNAGIPSLVDSLNTRLCGGQLSASGKTTIVNFVANNTNFAYSTPPTGAQIRDRIRAVVHLITLSPDFLIQK